MRKALSLTVLLLALYLNSNATRIFHYETYVGCQDMMYTWNDQVIITAGYMQRSDLLPYMIEGHEYMVKVTCDPNTIFQSVYTFCTQYTCNLNETDEEGNIINADYGTLSDGAYTGFFNIATDVPEDVQEGM